MTIEIPFEIGDKVFWKYKDGEEETMKIQFIGFQQMLDQELELKFSYAGKNPHLRYDSFTLPISKVKREIFIL